MCIFLCKQIWEKNLSRQFWIFCPLPRYWLKRETGGYKPGKTGVRRLFGLFLRLPTWLRSLKVWWVGANPSWILHGLEIRPWMPEFTSRMKTNFITNDNDSKDMIQRWLCMHQLCTPYPLLNLNNPFLSAILTLSLSIISTSSKCPSTWTSFWFTEQYIIMWYSLLLQQSKHI